MFKKLLQRLTIGYEVAKGGVNMVDVYIALITMGSRTIDSVPLRLRADVLAGLNAIGLDGYGNPIEE